MRRDDVIARLKTTEPTLRGHGVGRLYLFGSYARDEGRPGSDVDVFVDPAPGTRFGFDAYMDAHRIIEEALGAKADYGTRRGLHPGLLLDIERDAIRIF